MRKRRVTRPTGSVQHHAIRAREIVGDVLCLWAPLSPTKRAYRAVVEVSLLNFVLKAEEEQEALIERYRILLKSLTFPLHILVCHQRLDMRPYLAQVQAQSQMAARDMQDPTGQPNQPSNHAWLDLATGLAHLIQQVGSQRTLIERHCYLIIPAPDVVRATRGLPLLRPKQKRVRTDELVARALHELTVRVEMVQAQLAALGLRSQRLSGEVLARLYHRCATPEHALQHPLRRIHLAAVGHLPQIKGAAVGSALVENTRPAMPPGTPSSQDGKELLSQKGTRRVQKRRSRPSHASSILPPPDVLRLADLLAPGSLHEEHDGLRVDDEWVRGIAVTAFPREVSTGGWLAPLFLLDELVDLCFHLHPQDQAAMMRQLKRRRVGYASSRTFHRQQGRLADPELEVAHHDVARLMNQLVTGSERLFELSFLLLVRAPTRQVLEERSERLMTLLQTVFLDAVAHPTTFEHLLAWRSCLPEGHDELRRTITLDTASLATTFPFVSNTLIMPGGAFLGLTGTGEPVLLNPWDASLENPHAFVGGVTGAGKSYLGKLWLARSLLINGRQGERCSVIDPDGEYLKLATALGGSIVRIAPGSEHHLNPFDLLPPGVDFETYVQQAERLDRLAEKIQDLHSFLDLLLADHGTVLGTREKALLDRALYETYRRVGISSDPRTHYHPPPLLRDLAEVLKSEVCGPDEFELGWRLSRYVEGSLAGLFAQPTNVPLDSHLLVWDVREMRGDLRPVGIFLIADCLWTQAVDHRLVRRCLSIDEAASLIEHPEGGRFLATLSRRARKRYLRLVVMTQSPEAFVQDEWGSVVAANAAIKILKKQDRTSVRAVATRFGLTGGEEQRLLTSGVHEALLLAGDRRVLLTVRASACEHALMTTNPVELAEQQQARMELPGFTYTATPNGFFYSHTAHAAQIAQEEAQGVQEEEA